ncbi:MAG: response regulator [Clostridiales bacterium]|jgi:signal transduction histidine kinase/DNA-binding response OmpR family regulator/HAMP domain-containing protein|nr:response regulator [Clostridiales bacterium]
MNIKKEQSITYKILFNLFIVAVLLAAGIVTVMAFFMNSLTDMIALNMLQPMAKTASATVEGHLHTLVDRFFLMRENKVIADINAPAEQKQAELDYFRSGIETVWAALYDTEGKLITGSQNSPPAISGSSLYNLARDTLNPVIESTPSDSWPEIVIGGPVLSGNSAIAYLAMSYSYDVLGDVLANINISANGTAFIIDANASVIGHKDIRNVYNHALLTDLLGTDSDMLNLITLMRNKQTGAVNASGRYGRMYVGYAPIRGSHWSLGIQAPKSDFLSHMRMGIAVSVTITAAALAVVALIFRAILRKTLTSPLYVIIKSADNLAGGNFDGKLPLAITKRGDEIGQLGSAFHTMSDAVKTVISDIERLVSSARSGALKERADARAHQGDYSLIITGINSMLDMVCSHLDALPVEFALFNEFQRSVYYNRNMDAMLTRYSTSAKGGRVGSGNPIAMFLASGASRSLPPKAAALFGVNAENGDTYETELTMRDAAGTEYFYSVVLKRIGGIDAACVALVMRDVTMLTRAKKDAEAARSEAEVASRAKSDFLSNMSHEMRTPMNAIIGMTKIAQGTSDLEKKDYCLQKIENASSHLLGVINDVLDMSKIEANKFELSYEEFNFEKTLQKVTNVINFRVDEKNQNLTVHIDGSIPRVLIGDDQRLAQVITNLLSNAVKFTPENGYIRLDASVIKQEGAMYTMQVEVSDTGIGITQDQQARLFKSFQQADNNTSRKFGGTGLGLAISKRIVEMMNGQIWVESDAGRGSTFAFTICLESVSDERESLLNPGVNWSNIRLLVVDDSLDVCDYFAEIARQLGVNCDIAESGEQALEIINTNGPYDMYFIDWKMPGMGGIELASLISGRMDNKSVVVMISSAGWDLIEKDARKAGVNKFLPKPLFASDIADCINDCLGLDSIAEIDAQVSVMDNFEGYCLLLAEDVEINQEIVLALLEPTNISIDCAKNGTEAVEMFIAKPEKYDIIFMDVQMPEMDGYEATKAIRAFDVPAAKRVPIIAMTANVFREDVEKCLDAGMNAHIGKPLDFDEVLSRLREYLKVSNTVRSAAKNKH